MLKEDFMREELFGDVKGVYLDNMEEYMELFYDLAESNGCTLISSDTYKKDGMDYLMLLAKKGNGFRTLIISVDKEEKPLTILSIKRKIEKKNVKARDTGTILENYDITVGDNRDNIIRAIHLIISI
ncbi:MAG: hypothetical protein E7389_01225 [Ruminococcaceae bacterium]|nr:hypothetical protein [Oscillospiraceae bacterium]